MLPLVTFPLLLVGALKLPNVIGVLIPLFICPNSLVINSRNCGILTSNLPIRTYSGRVCLLSIYVLTHPDASVKFLVTNQLPWTLLLTLSPAASLAY